MIVTCVHIRVKKPDIDRFIEATAENHRNSVTEPGNLRFDFLQNDTEPDRFMIYEVYDSEEAVARHKETAHYLKWREEVQEMMAEARTGIRYSVIEPAAAKQWR